jgi:hypothetical protein
MSIPCGHKKNTETVAQYRKRCGPRPLGMIGKVHEEPRKPQTKQESVMKYCRHDECAKVAKHFYTISEKKDEPKRDKCYHKVKARYDVWPSAYASSALVKCRQVGADVWGEKSKKDEARKSCWVGYKQVGMKTKNGKKVPNCVPESYDVWNEKTGVGYTLEFNEGLTEGEYQGRDVTLNKPMAGDSKKFKVYVNTGKKNKDGTIKVKKVEFGQKGVKIKKSNPDRRKSFRARHNCDNPGPKTKARYWSCRKW